MVTVKVKEGVDIWRCLQSRVDRKWSVMKRETTRMTPKFLPWAVKGMVVYRDGGRLWEGKFRDDTLRIFVLDMSVFEMPIRHPSRDIQNRHIFKNIDFPQS